MIKIGILGDIGSGKTFVANQFGYPVFNADIEVSKIYKKNKKCFIQLKKKLPNYINSFPIKKKELTNAIFASKKNLKKIENIVHPKVRKNMKKFIDKNKESKILIFDIPLLLESKKYKEKEYVLVFVQANKKDIYKNLKKRINFNNKIFKNLKKSQLPVEIKKKNLIIL